MTDKELLELAAKAYGLNGEYYKKQRMVREFVFVTDEGMIAPGRTALSLWNPLTNDGDALRLAVKLLIDIEQFRNHSTAFYPTGWCDELHVSGADTATRRAIVRAAAAIGETLP